MDRTRSMGISWWVSCLAVGLLCGCRQEGPQLIPPQVLDPDGVGAAAVLQYDTNGNGQIEPAELASSPGLSDAVEHTDEDGDGNLTAEEIANRIRFHDLRKVRVMPVRYQVTLDGEPLADAKLTLVPERFYGGSLPGASGTTDAEGFVKPTVAFDEKLRSDELGPLTGVHPGVYHIEVSKKDASGAELVPAKYNTATQLGLEHDIEALLHDPAVREPAKLELTTR